MAEQKVMSTADAASATTDEPLDPNHPDIARQRRHKEAADKMMHRPELHDRVRAAHPHLGESDVSLQAALDDFARLEKENPKA